MSIQRIACSSCGSSRFAHDTDGNLVCEACGTRYASPREAIACRACGTLNPPDARYCANCSLQLGRTCSACAYANPPGVDNCQNCGEPLDIFSALSARHQDQQFGNVDRRTEGLVRSKSEDRQFLAEQREWLELEEQERQRRLGQQQARSRQQQTLLFGVVIAAIGLTLVGLVIAAIILGS
jgi:hypothetical protein